MWEALVDPNQEEGCVQFAYEEINGRVRLKIIFKTVKDAFMGYCDDFIFFANLLFCANQSLTGKIFRRTKKSTNKFGPNSHGISLRMALIG